MMSMMMICVEQMTLAAAAVFVATADVAAVDSEALVKIYSKRDSDRASCDNVFRHFFDHLVLLPSHLFGNSALRV